MPSFLGLYSSPAEHSTMGHTVFDLTSLACQPKSRERHLTFALSEQKSAYPAHTRDLEEDEDDEPSVCLDSTAVSEDEDASGATCIKKRTGGRKA